MIYNDNVIVHPATKALALKDICPRCRGELDTRWECNKCGYDAIEIIYIDLGLNQ